MSRRPWPPSFAPSAARCSNATDTAAPPTPRERRRGPAASSEEGLEVQEEAIVAAPAAPERVGSAPEHVVARLKLGPVGEASRHPDLRVAAGLVFKIRQGDQPDLLVLVDLERHTPVGRIAEGVGSEQVADLTRRSEGGDGAVHPTDGDLARVLDEQAHLVEPPAADVPRVVHPADPLEPAVAP